MRNTKITLADWIYQHPICQVLGYGILCNDLLSQEWKDGSFRGKLQLYIFGQPAQQIFFVMVARANGSFYNYNYTGFGNKVFLADYVPTKNISKLGTIGMQIQDASYFTLIEIIAKLFPGLTMFELPPRILSEYKIPAIMLDPTPLKT